MRLTGWWRPKVTVGALVALLLAGGVVSVLASPPAQAEMGTAVGQASSYAASRGNSVGISVIDRETGALYENALAHTQMRSASVPKVLVAESLLDRNRRGEIALTQRDRDLMWSMVARSDDAAMSDLYSRFGGLNMIVSVVGKYNLTEIGGPPTASYWGMYQITAHDITKFYLGVLDGGLAPVDRDLLVSLMRAATPTGVDGFDQYFGIPRGLPGETWGVKQGWMCCQEGQRRLHTTGILGSDNRFIVSVLSQSPQSLSYAYAAETLTTVVRTLFPGGSIPARGESRIPFGSLDVVWEQSPGRFLISGWTADPDAPPQSLDVHVYVDGRLAAYGAASGSRPDVGSSLPGYGDAHGYLLAVPVPDGRHTLCAYAINVGPGTRNPSLGCTSVEGRLSPVGNFEAASATGLRGMQVAGWTFDPESPATSTEVRFTVDGANAATTVADRSRPDVGSSFPGAGAAHGFSTVLGMAWPGRHQVCAYAVNVPGTGGGDALLTCRVVEGPVGLLGQFDAAVGGAGTVRLTGWAVDALDPTSTVPVHFYVDGQFAGAVAADTSRPDVGGVFPEAGPAHGFDTTARVTPGPHSVCVYAIYADNRGPNPALSCRDVAAS
jgi:hypothetical protein